MMKRSQIFLVFAVPLVLMGSKCQEDPKPVNLVGDWKWSCGSQIQDGANVMMPTCQEQVPADSPFFAYVKEHVRFSSEPKDWTAFFSFGTCVDTQTGTYIQEKNELRFYDSQGQLTQTYTVEKKSEDHLVLKQNSRSCDLTRDSAPEMHSGMHPKPQPTRLDWSVEIDGSLSSWNSQAQFPFVYQTPLLFAQPGNPSPYRIGLATLHITPEGSDLGHYAGAVFVYDRSSGALLSRSNSFEYAIGQTFTHQFVNAQGESVAVSVTPEQ